jgi:hypothetical protein
MDKMAAYSDANELHTQYVQQKNGIPKERILNYNKILIIEDLVKCSICLEILCKPYECEICGSLFCEDCINEWLKINVSCPMKCENFKMIRARPNTRKMLNLIKLRCINYPDCKYSTDYWEIFEHEKNCQFQKIRCPNGNCEFEGSFKELSSHMNKDCNYLIIQCGFCKSKIQKNFFGDHLDNHCKDRTFYLQNCCICNSNEDIKRCICKRCYCYRCLEDGEETECFKTCYLFHNNLNTTTQTYNISKYPLPLNFEVKLHFSQVDWVRTGITFNKEIINDQTDLNCPQYDIYCILEDLIQFYTLKNGWKNSFRNDNRPLKNGDNVTITLKNGELRYAVNDEDLGGFIKVDMTDKKEVYLLVHIRNDKSKCQILYITEIFN